MVMNVELLKYMDRKIRLKKDITHQEYTVLGIYWASEKLLVSGEEDNFTVHHTEVELVPEEPDEDEGWYPV